MSKGSAQEPRRGVAGVMGGVLLALVPAAIAALWFHGVGLAWRLLAAMALAVALEAALLAARGRPLRLFLSDLSAPVTGVLLVLWLPPSTPWWALCAALAMAIGVAKQGFGGLGYNVFNPAMAGAVLLLVLFPVSSAFAAASTAATPGLASLYGAGGLLLAWRGIITWHVPAAVLAGAAAAALLGAVLGTSALPTLATLFSAPLLLAAFFIATDPVTGCQSPRGRLLFGAGVGSLGVLLAPPGQLAHGLAFAVLLMNWTGPWLDRHTRPTRRAAQAPR